MVDLIRKQLNELMGSDRNEVVDTASSFTEPHNCRYYLVGLCPYDTLQKTKFDIGPCPYSHSLPAKTAYEEAAKSKDFGYEELLERKLKSLLRECDRRIDTSQRRIDEIEKDKIKHNPYDQEIIEQQEKYDKLMEEGDLDEANKVQEHINTLRTKRNESRTAAPPTEGDLGSLIAQIGSHPQYQALRVCEVCGLLLSAKETGLEDHFIGKAHVGFVDIRAKLAELANRDTTRPKADEYESEIPEPAQTYNRARDERRSRYNDRSHERDRERDRYRNKDRFRGGSDRRDDNDRRGGYRDRDGGYRDRDGGYRDRDGGYRDRDRGHEGEDRDGGYRGREGGYRDRDGEYRRE